MHAVILVLKDVLKNIVNSSGFIIGTLAGVIVSFMSYLFYDYWFKAPKLIIEDTDYYRIRDNYSQIDELYSRVKIRNDGRVVAQNCQCYLYLVGEGTDPPLLVEGSLCWSLLGNPHSISINPKSSALCDVCKFDLKAKAVMFPTEKI